MLPRLILALLLYLAASAGSQQAYAHGGSVACDCECDSTWIDDNDMPTRTLISGPNGVTESDPVYTDCIQTKIKYKICNKAVTGFNFEISNCDTDPKYHRCFDNNPIRFGFCSDKFEDMAVVPNPCNAAISYFQLTPIYLEPCSEGEICIKVCSGLDDRQCEGFSFDLKVTPVHDGVPDEDCAKTHRIKKQGLKFVPVSAEDDSRSRIENTDPSFKVQFTESTRQCHVYSNRLASAARIEIATLNGAVIQSIVPKSAGAVEFSLDNYSSGAYFIRLVQKDNSVSSAKIAVP